MITHVPRILDTTPAESLLKLNWLVLQVATYKTPLFGDRKIGTKADFNLIIEERRLFDGWRETVHIALQHGIDLPDEVLLCRYQMMHTEDGENLAEPERQMLFRVHDTLFSLWERYYAQEANLVLEGEPHPDFDNLNTSKPLSILDKSDCGTKGNKKGTSVDVIQSQLMIHHKYQERSCDNWSPVGCRELAKATGYSNAVVSTFFKTHFDGHKNYAKICGHKSKLIAIFAMWAGDISTKQLVHTDLPGRE